MKFDVSLDNAALYKGCSIQEFQKGRERRKNLTTPPEKAAEIVRKNALAIFDEIPREKRERVELTGRMRVWAYLVVCHAALCIFREVWYSDGRSRVPILVPPVVPSPGAQN